MKNRVAIVTGGRRGIGRAIVLKLLKEGYNVISCSKNEKNSEKENLLTMKCNVTNFGDIKKVYKSVIKKFGRVDILINNAGVAYYKKFENTNLKETNETINVNLNGVIYFTKIFLNELKKNKGCLINISSRAGLSPFENFSVYCASKYGVIGFSESLRKELEVVKVYCICPGPVDTNMFYSLFKEHPKTKAEDVAQKVFDCIREKYKCGVVKC